jgi:hypothetical protein
VAILPSPPRNASNRAGEGFAITFPNNAVLTTENAAGAMHQSSNNHIISNSVNPRFKTTWYAIKGRQTIEDAVVHVRDSHGQLIKFNSSYVTRSTWAFTLSRT